MRPIWRGLKGQNDQCLNLMHVIFFPFQTACSSVFLTVTWASVVKCFIVSTNYQNNPSGHCLLFARTRTSEGHTPDRHFLLTILAKSKLRTVATFLTLITLRTSVPCSKRRETKIWYSFWCTKLQVAAGIYWEGISYRTVFLGLLLLCKNRISHNTVHLTTVKMWDTVVASVPSMTSPLSFSEFTGSWSK